MEYRAFRVMRPFKWNGWHYAPRDGCKCDCSKPVMGHIGDGTLNSPVQEQPVDGPIPDCTRQPGTECRCRETVCECSCGMPAATFAGDLWIVDVQTQLERQEGRVYALVEISRHARPDLGFQDRAINADGSVKEDYIKFLDPPLPDQVPVGAFAT